MSAAYFLADRARVLVLERESQPAYHSSGRSAALYIEGYENPVVSDLTKDSGPFFFDPPDGFADSPLLNYRGGLTLAGPGDEGGLEEYLAVWQPACPELKRISTAETRELVPIVRPDWAIGAGYDPSWKSIDVHELLMGYQRGLKANGGAVETGAEVTGLAYNGNWSVSTLAATYSAPIVVNAAGSWAASIGSLAGLEDVPLQPLRRTGVIVPPPDGVESFPVAHTVRGELYFKPENPGLMVSPADETPSEPTDAQPEELDVAIALDRLQTIVDFPVQRIMHSWAGLRTFAPDRRPVIGFDARAEGFCWVAGQGGFGVQTSPALGSIVAEHVLGAPLPRTEIDVSRWIS